MSKVWLHRITGGENAAEYSYPLLFEHNILSIGWAVFSTDAFVISVVTDGAKAIDKRTEEIGWGKPRNRWNLYRFIHSMKKGDRVVVPSCGHFSIFEISSDKVYSNESIDKSLMANTKGERATFDENNNYFHNKAGKRIDLGFYREVKPIAVDIPRKYADQALTSFLKFRLTNADITKIAASIKDAEEAFEKKKPLNLKEKLMEVLTKPMLQIISEKTDDARFESMVAWYLRTLGAGISIPSKNSSPTEDGDADVVAFFDKIKTVIMVQVKKHKNITNKWAIEQIDSFSQNHNYDDYSTQMWVISTCNDFSEDAKLKAQDAHVRLINGNEFCEMILDNGLQGLKL